MCNLSLNVQIIFPHCSEEKFRKDRHLYIGFIDLKAAFDTVCHTSLWSILHALGVPPKIVALFKLLYSNAQSCVRINGRDSDSFPISSGVRQGCVAAPDLFNCIITTS
ncbi:gamma-aminobutyric acid receptor subunit alpha-2-like [Tachysurus ichikawai]